jgi:hypothetical protein
MPNCNRKNLSLSGPLRVNARWHSAHPQLKSRKHKEKLNRLADAASCPQAVKDLVDPAYRALGPASTPILSNAEAGGSDIGKGTSSGSGSSPTSISL